MGVTSFCNQFVIHFLDNALGLSHFWTVKNAAGQNSVAQPVIAKLGFHVPVDGVSECHLKTIDNGKHFQGKMQVSSI